MSDVLAEFAVQLREHRRHKLRDGGMAVTLVIPSGEADALAAAIERLAPSTVVHLVAGHPVTGFTACGRYPGGTLHSVHRRDVTCRHCQTTQAYRNPT